MALDGLLLAGIVRKLEPLTGSKISKIQNLSDEEVLFNIHGKNGTFRLVINTHSNTNRLYLAKSASDFLQTPSNFVMVLRKYLTQGIITEIEQAGFDRLVRFGIQGHNELGDTRYYDLYAELMGKYANLVLVDRQNETIVDSLKRIPVYENTKRLIHPGAPYTLPPKQEKASPLHPGEINPDQSLVKQVEGFSPLLSKEYQYRMNNGETFEDITKELFASDTLYIYPKDYHLIELKHLNQPARALPMMDGLNELYRQDEQKVRIKEQCGDVFRAVDREKKRLEKKLPKLQDALEASFSYEEYRKYGDLLFAYMYDLEKTPKVTLPDFETGEDVTFDIDMRYDLKTNANLFYKKYHKMKRSQSVLEEQIAQCEDEIRYYTQLQEQLKYCSVDDALEIREELINNHILFGKQSNLRRKKNKAPHVLHLRFDDYEIYAGKNNLQNSYITHKLGRREDLWFHVKDYHGSHVLLKSEEPNEEQIRMCANLAAYFSKGKDGSSVPVDYTQIRNLKKVPGSKAGFVTMKTYKTIFIDPDARAIEETISKHKVK